MRPFVLLPYYIHWHYSQAIQNIFSITKNFVWFFWHFFSIGILSKTLFAPWQKIQEERPNGMEFGPILGTWVINILMRMAGALIRLTMIVMGLGTIIVTMIGSIFVTLIWIALPLCMLFALLVGVVILFKPV